MRPCGVCPRVNDIALGIAIMLFGTGLAFYLGKPFIQPQAPRLPAIPFGWWSSVPQVQAALQVNVLFLLGAGLVPVLAWGLTHTRWGLILQTVGDSADAARALGYSVDRVRWAATALGGFLAGVGGSFLSLYYPGSWNEGLSSGQGLMAVALVIFARWDPSTASGRRCSLVGLVPWDQPCSRLASPTAITSSMPLRMC